MHDCADCTDEETWDVAPLERGDMWPVFDKQSHPKVVSCDWGWTCNTRVLRLDVRV